MAKHVLFHIALVSFLSMASIAGAADELYLDEGDDSVINTAPVAKARVSEPSGVRPPSHAKPLERKAASVGTFLTTGSECLMMAEPIEDGVPVLKLKPSRKIWTEPVDSEWVRAFDRHGAPGYIRRSCLK